MFRRDAEKNEKIRKNEMNKKRKKLQNWCQSENLQSADKWAFLQQKKH